MPTGFGAVDEHGNFVDPHKIFSVLLRWLLERKGWTGGVTRAFNTTKMLDRIAAKHDRRSTSTASASSTSAISCSNTTS